MLVSRRIAFQQHSKQSDELQAWNKRCNICLDVGRIQQHPHAVMCSIQHKRIQGRLGCQMSFVLEAEMTDFLCPSDNMANVEDEHDTN